MREFLGPEGCILDELGSLQENVSVVEAQYTTREPNKVARALAKYTPSSSHPQTWVGAGIPRWIKDEVRWFGTEISLQSFQHFQLLTELLRLYSLAGFTNLAGGGTVSAALNGFWHLGQRRLQL